MEIRIDKIVREKYHEGFSRNGILPSVVVIHASAGLNPYKWVRDGERLGNPRIDLYKKGVALWHYTIDIDEIKNGIEQDSIIVETIDPSNFTYHCHAGEDEVKTIGIEMEHPDNGSNPFTNGQYKALSFLLDDIFGRYPIKEISSHNVMKMRYKGSGKRCPGPGFDWQKIKSHIEDRKFAYRYSDESFTDISTKPPRTMVV